MCIHTRAYVLVSSVVIVMESLAGPPSTVTAYIVHSYVVDGVNPVTVPLVLVPETLT